MSLSQQNQSSLGAFVESQLRARDVAVAETTDLVLVLTFDSELYAFDAFDLSLLFGPLVLSGLPTGGGNGVDANDDGQRFFLNQGDSLRAFAPDGAVVWTQNAGVGEQFGIGLGFALNAVWAVRQHTITNADDALTLERRDVDTGAVANSLLIHHDQTTPFKVTPFGFCTQGGKGYVLYAHELPANKWTVICDRVDLATVVVDATRTFRTDHSPPFVEYGLGRGVGAIYVGDLAVDQVSFDQWDAVSPATMADLDSLDFLGGAGVSLGSAVCTVALDVSEPEVNGPFALLQATGVTRLGKFKLDNTSIGQGALMDAALSTHNVRAVALAVALQLNSVVDSQESDDPYSQQMTAVVGGAPSFWTLHAAPSGATISGTGLVEWPAPVKAGSPHTFRVYAYNGAGWDSEEWTVSIQDTPPVIDPIADDVAFTGNPYLKQPTLTSGDLPVVWSLDSAPPGATITPDMGQITWPSPAGGPVSWIVRATNAKGFDTEAWTTTVL